MKIENIKPNDIEKKSFEIITSLLGDKKIPSEYEAVIKRCIHTSADFDYADNLYFSPNVVDILKNAIKSGAHIVTDTSMAKAGINKQRLSKYGGEVHCFISDDDVAAEAKRRGVTRSLISMEKASKIDKPLIFAIGNAPTALISLYNLITDRIVNPCAIIGAPVGFVNVIESKELIMTLDTPCIVAKGRKGGSNIAAAIVNAILYNIDE